MASSNKTNHLGLNSWVDEDRPKRIDFVNDNEKIDSAIKEHTQSTNIHVTEAEKQLLGNIKVDMNTHIFMGSYVGNGLSERIIEMEKEADFIIIFAGSQLALVQYVPIKSSTTVQMGFASNSFGSKGLALNKNSFTLTRLDAPKDGYGVSLNFLDTDYGYIAFKI